MRHFNKLIGLLVAFAIVISCSTTAFAGYYQDQYAAAAARGDSAGMEAAHAGAVAAGTSNQPDRPTTVPAPNPPSGYSAAKDNSNVSDFSVKAPSVLTPAVDTNVDYQSKINEAKEMDADHVTAWSKGGATDIRNCEMLCVSHNRAKGNK